MKTTRLVSGMLVGTCIATLFAGLSQAQTKAGGAPPAQAKAKAAAPAATMPNLAQVMRGILYPNSNVIFWAQSQDPAKDVKPEKDAATAVNPLANAYGKWEAVENSSLALVEATRLLTVPGRKCQNGRPVPMGNADWPKFVAGLRAAGMTAYRAAQSKNQDKILDAAEVVTTACSNCHDKYRETATLQDRCK